MEKELPFEKYLNPYIFSFFKCLFTTQDRKWLLDWNDAERITAGNRWAQCDQTRQRVSGRSTILEMSVLKLHHLKFWLCWIKTRRVGFNVFVMVWEHWRFSAQTWFQNKFVFQNKIFFQTMNLNYKFTIYINLIALNHPKIFKYVL